MRIIKKRLLCVEFAVFLWLSVRKVNRVKRETDEQEDSEFKQ